MTIFVAKRIYEKADKSDGYRVLVDRLWPRGISKERALLDEWAKEIAPSNELRRWFNHMPENYNEFVKKYTEEINNNHNAKTIIDNWLKHNKVTLLYGARDTQHNEVTALIDMLK